LQAAVHCGSARALLGPVALLTDSREYKSTMPVRTDPTAEAFIRAIREKEISARDLSPMLLVE